MADVPFHTLSLVVPFCSPPSVFHLSLSLLTQAWDHQPSGLGLTTEECYARQRNAGLLLLRSYPTTTPFSLASLRQSQLSEYVTRSCAAAATN